MLLGCKKSSLKYGYNVHEIIELIDQVLDTNKKVIPIALVGDCGSFINGFLVDYLGEKIKISAVFNLGMFTLRTMPFGRGFSKTFFTIC